MLNKTKYWLTSYFLIFLSCYLSTSLQAHSIFITAPDNRFVKSLGKNKNGKLVITLRQVFINQENKLFLEKGKFDLPERITLKTLFKKTAIYENKCDYYLAVCKCIKISNLISHSYEVKKQLDDNTQLFDIPENGDYVILIFQQEDVIGNRISNILGEDHYLDSSFSTPFNKLKKRS